MLFSKGTVSAAASAAPPVSAATYDPVIAPVWRSKRLFTTLGTITFAIATPAPAKIVPAKSAAVEPAARPVTPRMMGSSASSSRRSAPTLLAKIGETSASAPKQSTGAAVSTPAAVADNPSSR